MKYQYLIRKLTKERDRERNRDRERTCRVRGRKQAHIKALT